MAAGERVPAESIFETRNFSDFCLFYSFDATGIEALDAKRALLGTRVLRKQNFESSESFFTGFSLI